MIMSRSSRRTWRRIRSLFIWLAVPILVWIWTEPVQPSVRAVIATIYAAFFLLAAPVWCGAVNRDGTSCRNNSTGLLIGCHLRQHRWQKLNSMARLGRARQMMSRLFRDPHTAVAIVGAAAAVLSAAAAWTQVAPAG